MHTLIKNDCYFDLKALSAFSYLGISTLREHIAGGMPHYRVRGKILIKRSEFEAWMIEFKGQKEQDLKDIANEAIKAVSKY